MTSAIIVKVHMQHSGPGAASLAAVTAGTACGQVGTAGADTAFLDIGNKHLEKKRP